MGASLSLIGPALGIGGSLFNMFGGGGNSNASNVQLPSSWQAPGMDAAAGSALAGIPGQGQYNTFGQSLPQAGQTSQNLFNNPYASFMQDGAMGAAGMAMNGANNTFNAGSRLYGSADSLYPYAQSVMQTGFDPQNALYDRTQHKIQEQTRAGQAARGIATTPYGAGLEDQAMRNFNIDWQNQQLQRQVQGLGAGAGALNTGAGITSTGAQITGAAPGQYMQGATYPYATYNTVGQGQMGALNQFGQFGQNASGIPQNMLDNYLKYMQMGNQAGGVANQTAQLGLNQSNLAFNQGQTMGNQLGQGIFGLGQAMNKYPGGGPMTGGVMPSPQYMTNGYQGPV